MKKISEFIWPIIGIGALVVSGWLLYRELKDISTEELITHMVGRKLSSIYQRKRQEPGAVRSPCGSPLLKLHDVAANLPAGLNLNGIDGP